MQTQVQVHVRERRICGRRRRRRLKRRCWRRWWRRRSVDVGEVVGVDVQNC